MGYFKAGKETRERGMDRKRKERNGMDGRNK